MTWKCYAWWKGLNEDTSIINIVPFPPLSLPYSSLPPPPSHPFLSQALMGECGFLAANLYARSIFGEDALANLSIEKPVGSSPDVPVQGHIRIRAKTQVRRKGVKTRVW